MGILYHPISLNNYQMKNSEIECNRVVIMISIKCRNCREHSIKITLIYTINPVLPWKDWHNSLILMCDSTVPELAILAQRIRYKTSQINRGMTLFNGYQFRKPSDWNSTPFSADFNAQVVEKPKTKLPYVAHVEEEAYCPPTPSPQRSILKDGYDKKKVPPSIKKFSSFCSCWDDVEMTCWR